MSQSCQDVEEKCVPCCSMSRDWPLTEGIETHGLLDAGNELAAGRLVVPTCRWTSSTLWGFRHGCFSALSALSVSETGRKFDKALLVEGHHNTVLLYFIQASWQGALHSQCSVLSPDCQCISYIHRAVLFTRLPSP